MTVSARAVALSDLSAMCTYKLDAELLGLCSGAGLLFAAMLYQRLLSRKQDPPGQASSVDLPPPRMFGRSTCHTVTSDVFELREESAREDCEDDTEPIKTRHILLSEAEAEKVLCHTVSSTTVTRIGNPVHKLESAWLAGNAPNEDALAVDVLPGDLAPLLKETGADGFWMRWHKFRRALYGGAELHDVKGGDGAKDRIMLSIMDGHGGGPEVAEQLRKTVHACLAYALATQPGAPMADVMSRT